MLAGNVVFALVLFLCVGNVVSSGILETSSIALVTETRAPYVVDLNEDSELDVLYIVLVKGFVRIAWAENLGDGRFWRQHTLDTSESAWDATVVGGDVNGDEHVDVLVNHRKNGTWAIWVYYGDGSGSFSVPQVVVPDSLFFLLSDLDGDGTFEVINSGAYTSGPRAGVHSFFNGSWVEMATFGYRKATRCVVDLDGDGNRDIVHWSYSSSDSLTWVRNDDPSGLFRSWTYGGVLVFANFKGVDCGDIDGDADMDVVFFDDDQDKMSLLKNDGSGSVWTRYLLEDMGGMYTLATRLADVDGDGMLDVLTMGYSSLYWMRNANGSGLLWDPVLLDDDSEGGFFFVSDMDKDGDWDFVHLREDAVVLSTFALNATKSFVVHPSPEALNATVGDVRVVVVETAANGDIGLFFDPSPSLSVLLRVGSSVAALNSTWVGTSLHLSFTLQVGLPHELSVQVGNHHVTGSPLTFSVRTPCPPDAYAPSFGECTPCPIGMSAPPFASSFLQCECPAGSWYGFGVRTPSSGCVECPVGAVCVGGQAPPSGRPGYFEVTPGSYRYVPCVRKGCGGNSTCLTGYAQSFMCGRCADGYYSRSRSECVECPSAGLGLAGTVVVAAVVGGVVVGGLVVVSIGRLSSSGEEGGERRGVVEAFRQRKLPGSVGMVVTAFQIADVIGNVGLGWPSSSSSVLRWMGVFNLGVQDLGSECKLGFYVTYVASVALPFVVVVGATGAGLVVRQFSRSVRESGVSIGAIVGTAVLAVGPFVYLPVCKATFVLFDCVRLPNGEVVLDSDRGQACFSSGWWSAFPVGLGGVVLYVIGLPAYIGWTLYGHRDRLLETSTIGRCGMLYQNWRVDYYYGEVCNLIRRLGVVVVSVFFTSSPVLQIIFLVVILSGSSVLVLRGQPYYYDVYNRVEAWLSFCVCGVLIVGVGAYTEDGGGGSEEDVVFGLTVIAVASLVAVSVYGVSIDVLQLRKERKEPRLVMEMRALGLRKSIESELREVGGGGGDVLKRQVGELFTFATAPAVAMEEGGIDLECIGKVGVDPVCSSSSSSCA